jgi:hypothetical protein
MPSTEITVRFAEVAAVAAGPCVLGIFRTSHAAGGDAIEDGELWTEAGHPILQARQLRCTSERT